MSLFQKKQKTPAFLTGDNNKTLHKNLGFTAIEQYKLLRTNLQFVLSGDEKCPIIGVTSSVRGEGKSTTAINLAYVLAENGSKVVLIDGDLRLPVIAKRMELKNNVGLTSILMGKGARVFDFKTDLSKNLFVIPSGEIPPNPSELLGSKKMDAFLKELRELFDYVVIDLPPVNIVSDAVSASPWISGMVVVTREDYTEKRELDDCFRQLELSNVKILGCVMTCAKHKGGGYGKYKRYKYFGRYGKYGHSYALD